MSFGMTEPVTRKNLKRRFEWHKILYGRFARLTVTRTRSNEEEEYSEEYSEEDAEEEDGNNDSGRIKTIQDFDQEKWD